jgi:hypothetical protein
MLVPRNQLFDVAWNFKELQRAAGGLNAVPCQKCRLADVLGQGEETGFRPAHAYRLIAALLQPLSGAPPGWRVCPCNLLWLLQPCCSRFSAGSSFLGTAATRVLV